MVTGMDAHATPPSSSDPLATGGDLAGAPVPSATAPAVRPPRWSGKKTAVVAALAIGVATGGTMAAAAALPAGSAQLETGSRTMGPGGPGRHAAGTTGTATGQGTTGTTGTATGSASTR